MKKPKQQTPFLNHAFVYRMQSTFLPFGRNTLLVGLMLLGFLPYLQAQSSFILVDSLPVPGTSSAQEFLSNDLHGTIAENGNYELVWKNDGALAIRFKGGLDDLWSSGTEGKGTLLTFQESAGKLIIKDGGTTLWETDGSDGSKLEILDNQNLVMYNSSGEQIWETGTAIPEWSNTAGMIAYTGTPEDFIIPEFEFPAGVKRFVRLTAEGADGGKKQVKEIDGSNRFTVKAGAGATIASEFELGTESDMIPPKSIIRVIVGQKGSTRTGQTTSGCAGGGGTAIFVKKYGESKWYLLVAAGAGGGAYSTCCGSKSEGKSGETSTSGSGGHGGSNAPGGTNGQAGGFPNSSDSDASPGGGAFQGGDNADIEKGETPRAGDSGWLGGSLNGSIVLPLGGAGSPPDGGWGFGGGGDRGIGGGGGGGFSGGGQGYSYFGGGGGGSYTSDWSFRDEKTKNPTTSDTQDGHVAYDFYEICSIGITYTANEPEECGVPESGDVSGFVDLCNEETYHLIIKKGSRALDTIEVIRSNPDWGFAGLDAGNYVLELRDANSFFIARETFTLTVEGDRDAPDARCKDIQLNLEQDSEPYILSITDVNDGSTDDCTIADISFVDPSDPDQYVQQLAFDVNNPGSKQRTLSVVDELGRRSNCDFTVNVEDIPSFPNGCAGRLSLDSDGLGVLSADYITINVGAKDLVTNKNGLVYTWEDDGSSFSCDNIDQTFSLDITVMDRAGNTATCNATITIKDPIAPTITCQDVTYIIDESGNPSISYTDFIVSASDNCLSEAEIIGGYYWDTSILPLDLDCSHVGTYDIALASNAVAHETLPACEARLIIKDAIAPTISCRDTTIYLNQRTGSFSAETLPITSVSDNCYDASELTYDWKKKTTFTCVDRGSDEEFWAEVKDPNNNSARCVFTVTVVDDTEEIVPTCRTRTIELVSAANYAYTLRPEEFFTGLTSPCGSLLDYPGTLTFSDDTDAFLDCEDIGEPHPITIVYTPDDGRPTTTCETSVSVREALYPTFTCPSGIIDLDATFEDCGAFFEYEYSVSDQCPVDDLNITLEEGRPSGSIFPVGWNNVKISAQDKSGNYNACQFVVRVAGPTDKPTLSCPGNYTVQIPDGECEVVVDTTPVYDFDYGCYTRNYQSSGQSMGSAFTPGTYTMEFRSQNNFTDEFSKCSFKVSVKKDEKPVAVCKDTTLVLTTRDGVSLNPALLDGGSYGDCYEVNNWTLFDGRFSTSVFSCSKVGTKEYTLRVRNTAGATSTCSSNITVVPKDPDCLDTTVINLDNTGNAILTVDDIFIDDRMCSGTKSLSQSTFDCTDVGLAQVVTLTRIIGEYTGQCSTVVTVEGAGSAVDVTPPVALCKPDTTVYVESDYSSLIPIEWVDAGSYDNESCQVDLVLSDSIHSCADLGPYEYTLYVTDANGNQSTCKTTITTADTLAPEILYCNDITIDLDAQGTYVLTDSDLESIVDQNEVCVNIPIDVSQLRFNYDCSDAGRGLPMTITISDIHGNTDDCNFVVIVNDPFDNCPSNDLLVSIKTMLEGAYESAEGLMHDDLRSLDLLPSIEPYENAGETISPTALAVSGDDAVVDWVLLELRDPLDASHILYTRSALLQRDGDIVDVDGVSPVLFPNAGVGDYYVAIRHRNHLGVMTATTLSLSSTTTNIDFTDSATVVYGSNSRIDLGGGLMAMYGADSNGSETVDAYDRSLVWNELGLSGYRGSDCNLDGATNELDRNAAWENRSISGTLPAEFIFENF